MKLGFMIEYGRGHYFQMKVNRKRYHSSICGLCGDYNGNKKDEFKAGPRCDQKATPGTLVSLVLLLNL